MGWFNRQRAQDRVRRFKAAVIAAVGVAAVSPLSADEPAFKKATYTYKTVGEEKVEADVYRESDARVRPVLVWIHGGALVMGTRGGAPRDLLDLCRTAGYCLVSIDYRLAPEVKLAEIIDDLRHALRWVREEGPKLFHADPGKLVVSGGSAGGYLTLMAGVVLEPPPTALVAYWGYGDVDGDWYTKPSEHYLKAVPRISEEEARKAVGKKVLTGTEDREMGAARLRYYHYLRQNGLWTREVTGFDPATEGRKLDPFCPIRNVTPRYPPTLLIHGTDDTDVPHDRSAEMAEALRKQKVPHELISVRKAGHGLGGGEEKEVARARAAAIEFIRRRME